MKKSAAGQRGVGHLGLIMATVVLLAIGGVGYFVFTKNKNSHINTSDQTLQMALQNAKCEYDDADLCKFFTSYKLQKYFTMTSINETGGQKTTMILKKGGDDKTHVKVVSSNLNYEVIAIGNRTYTKAGDTWWKKVNDKPQPVELASEGMPDLAEPEGNSLSYKKVAKEACGNLRCFKYRQIDPTGPAGVTYYLWFDDGNYQLRRTVTESTDSTYDAIYSYEKFSIKEPTPAQELGPNQHIVPGQSEPTSSAQWQ